MDITGLIVQVVVAAVPLGVAWFAYRSATDANRRTQQSALIAAERQAEIERTKVDAEAFARAKAIYEDALAQLERQFDRLGGQFERVTEQLAAEQDTSINLRVKVQALQAQVRRLEHTVAELRRLLDAAGIPPQAIADVGDVAVGSDAQEGL